MTRLPYLSLDLAIICRWETKHSRENDVAYQRRIDDPTPDVQAAMERDNRRSGAVHKEGSKEEVR
jgi:hypothetical protein